VTLRQRDLVSKYLADLSKGVLIAVAVGVGTGKLDVLYVVVYLVAAVLAFGAAYFLEGMADAADESV
jgi:hypothetical protein